MTVTGNNKHGFTNDQSCLSSLIIFHDEITSLVDGCSVKQGSAHGLFCPKLMELLDRMGWASQGTGGSGTDGDSTGVPRVEGSLHSSVGFFSALNPEYGIPAMQGKHHWGKTQREAWACCFPLQSSEALAVGQGHLKGQ